MKKIPFRLALAGCGDIARYVALLVKTLPSYTITSCCSANLNEAQIFARKYKIPTAEPDYSTMLDHSQYDAVYLSVPHHLHLPMLRQAVEHGIPVLCEKPIAANIPQAKEMIELSQNSGVKTGINYQYRYDSKCWQMKQEISRKHLGQISHIRINIPWYRKLDYFEKSPWHKSFSTAGGGTLLTQGSHFLDIALWCLESTPLRTMGYTGQQFFNQPDIEVEDLAMGIIEMTDGTLINITSSMTAVPEKPASIEIYGEKGTLIYHSGFLPNLQYNGISKSRLLPKLPITGIHPLARSLQGFRNWVQDGAPYFTPIEDAFLVMASIDALYRSSHSGQSEDINLV